MLLAIETIDRGGTVGLAREGRSEEIIYRHSRQPHSQRLFAALDSVVAAGDLDYEKIEAVAVLKGPGAFTAIRLGVTVAKVLAVICQASLVGVSSLRLLARYGVGQEKLIRAVIGARRGELYHQDFSWDRSRNRLQKESAPRLIEPNKLRTECFEGPESLLIYRGRQWSPVPEEWPGEVDFYPQEQARLLVPPLIEVAKYRLKEGNMDDPDHLKPFYLRKSDAREPGGN